MKDLNQLIYSLNLSPRAHIFCGDGCTTSTDVILDDPLVEVAQDPSHIPFREGLVQVRLSVDWNASLHSHELVLLIQLIKWSDVSRK